MDLSISAGNNQHLEEEQEEELQELQQSQQMQQIQNQTLQSHGEQQYFLDIDGADSINSRDSLKYCPSSMTNVARPDAMQNLPANDPVSPPLRVRDMIKIYNSAVNTENPRQSQLPMASSRSCYFGVNRFSKENVEKLNLSRLNSKLQLSSTDLPTPSSSLGSLYRVSSQFSANTYRRNSPRRETQTDLQSTLRNQSSFINLSRSNKDLDVGTNTAAQRDKKRRHTSATSLEDSSEENNAGPVESYYQSKTTIAKTANGVRIIIDIFFDQNRNLGMKEVVGSRVETDIPPSKILSEFQQRAVTKQRN